MPEIHGRFEWDDESLSPGRKKEGGLHGNLYDSEGHLRANARFIPEDEGDSIDAPTQSELEDERARRAKASRRAERDAELAEFVAEVLFHLISKGIIKAAPHVAAWWNDKVRPALQSRWRRFVQAVQRRRRPKEQRLDLLPELLPATEDEVWQDLASPEASPADMSRSEAQARLLLAMAAQALSGEQLRLVSNARIYEDEGFRELQQAIVELPADVVASALSDLQTDPSTFSMNALDRLGSRSAGRGKQLESKTRRSE